MSSPDLSYPSPTRGPSARSWLGKAEDWLDDRGKGAWIAAMIVGFVLFWPVGLAILAYMIWSKRMFSKHRHDGFGRSMMCGSRREKMDQWRNARTAMRPSGNAAFDAYKAETLRRLEDEQRAFEEFLARLREARDKAEFDQFMEDRARRARNGNGDDQGQDAA
ncbi:DUF2852 domain-containing protein [Rubellimicrobium arenae]|uniref:DUF2852 domain-containing protein n=1 Tax=Rubellimicrobium arenae TaxID=2817372 RepID=UPI001B30294B|nr:DUF2852 domain-containing protein [Rubellimicrobium arenae]